MPTTLSADEFAKRYGQSQPARGVPFTLSPEEFSKKYGTSVADTARRRLEAQGVNPDVPVDPEDNRQPGFWRGLYDSIVPSREAIVTMAKLANAQGPIEQAKAAYGVGKGIVEAQVDQGKKAYESYKQGDLIEGAGHALAAGVPLVGPAAAEAGEEIAEGNIGYGLGKATGLVGQVLVPSGAGRAAEGVAAAAPVKIAAAEAKYASTFGKKNAALAEKLAPEMMDRGMVVSEGAGLADQAGQAASAIDVDALVQQAAASGQKLDVQPILQRIQQAQADEFHVVNGQSVPKSPESQAIADSLQEYSDILAQHADSAGKIDPVQALELRRTWEAKPGERNFYTNPNLKVSDPMKVRMEAADSVRPEINTLPGVGAANAEKSLQLNIQKIAESMPKTKGVGEVLSEGGKKIAVGIAASHVPVPGAQFVGGGAAAYGAYQVLRDLPKTPAWKTAGAIHKRNFYKAMKSKDLATAAEIGAGIVSGQLIADDFGYKSATQQLMRDAESLGDPSMSQRYLSGQTARYVGPDGATIEVPRGIMIATMNGDMSRDETPMTRWLSAMEKQKKIKPGGRIQFEDRPTAKPQRNPG